MNTLANADVLILDDCGLQPLDGDAGRHLVATLEDCCGRRPAIVTCQLRAARRHEWINDPTYADAFPDRLVHHAPRPE